MYTAEDVTFDSLLERLGGRDILTLMIDARDFAPTNVDNLGLQFDFRIPGVSEFCRVKLVPFVSWYMDFREDVVNYQVIMSMCTESGMNLIGYGQSSLSLGVPDHLARTFERIAGCTLSF